MLAVFGAPRSSPGVTTAVVAVASCAVDAVVVEGDPDGGVLAARFGLAKEPGLTTMAAAVRSAPEGSFELDAHQQALPGGVRVVAGPASAESATALWRSAGPRLVSALAGVATSRPVVVDAGRLSPVAPTGALLDAADVLVVVVRPHLEDLHALAARAKALQGSTSRLAVLLVGDQPYGPADVADQLDVEVLGVLAHDRRAADALAGRGWSAKGLRRSSLARSARVVAERLLASERQGVLDADHVLAGGQP